MDPATESLVCAVVCCFQNMSHWQISLGSDTNMISNVGSVFEQCAAVYKKDGHIWFWSLTVAYKACQHYNAKTVNSRHQCRRG